MRRNVVMGWVGGLSLVCAASLAAADETLQKIAWDALKKQGRITAGEVETDGNRAVLKVVSEKAGPTTYSVLTIEKPGVTRARYAIRGRLRTEGVEGKGYLEMWNHFGGDKSFSRNLVEEGPMRHLGGSSDWREFVLPFVNKEGEPAPDRLELNVVLPGKGTVWLGPLELIHFDSLGGASGSSGAWWSDRTAGLVFGGLGGVIGILGGLIGTLCSLGRGRGFVMGLLWAMLLFGAVSLLAGIFALTQGQPYAVVYPLLLLGIIEVLVAGLLIPVAKRRYQSLELRKMSAMDAGRA